MPTADEPAGSVPSATGPPRFVDDLVRHAAQRVPDRVAVVGPDASRTFAEIDDRVARWAGALRMRAGRGARVAVLADNGARYAELYSAAPRAGWLLGLLNHRLHPSEWARAIARLEPKVLVSEPAHLDRLDVRAARDAGVETIVGLGPHAAADLVESELLAADPFLPATDERRPDDVVWLVGTSGTTGLPKFAQLTHASLLAAVDATLHARPVGPDDTLLTPFPMCHVAGYNVLVFHRRARPVVLMHRFDPAELLALVREHGVTVLSLAPTMIAMLLDDPGMGPEALGAVHTIGYGASAMPADVLRRAVAELGCGLSQGYGMTELSGNAVFLGPAEHRRAAAGDDRLLGAAGHPAPGVELAIVDDTGAPCAPGTAGEITVRAPQVARGYWRDEAATRDTFVGGWLRTGDVGFVDPDGDLHVVDRKKDVIVSGGENVASREVESVLRLHPGVADVAVVGVPDGRWGERVCAVVVRVPGVPVEEEDLIALSRAHLAGFKTPRVIVFVDALPTNASGKVLKRALREELAREA